MHPDLVERARLFATAAHAAIDQRRKYSGAPYIEHPEAVARLVAEHGADEVMIAAAWLHDVVEDTEVSLELVSEEFGKEVSDLVDALSDLQTAEDGNRRVRKQRAAERLAQADPRAQTIKYADLIHNTSSIVRHDRGFAYIYLEEKRYLLEMMTQGEPGLRQKAFQMLEVAEGELSSPRRCS
ncbi:HD domain-containing protein [Halomonas huangheensis]|uniref:Guanosine-3',5'-bis(Diphosphate) 3'-pyrophosphohydrolase n=1 Tax=Halomonas huangheensis TaxID=1178482 RepID=W1NAV2_9GAMM|nr:HD domain-containing protein [Halomonas huangheensis]ALM52519.1 hypothetical protein AR456_09700 [Halomonas huangheensis]ERL52659.1 Guanosine-3',5'-bis(Diphosphate) 3'-pyrophosphohydrolase [Halomonas huangheensis]